MANTFGTFYTIEPPIGVNSVIVFAFIIVPASIIAGPKPKPDTQSPGSFINHSLDVIEASWLAGSHNQFLLHLLAL